MNNLRIKVRCKKVNLETEIMLSDSRDCFPESLGFIPPLGTTLTFQGFKNPEWNGVYKVINVEGNMDMEPSGKYGGVAVVRFSPDYIVNLEKVK